MHSITKAVSYPLVRQQLQLGKRHAWYNYTHVVVPGISAGLQAYAMPLDARHETALDRNAKLRRRLGSLPKFSQR